jgi:hypothetical protein
MKQKKILIITYYWPPAGRTWCTALVKVCQISSGKQLGTYYLYARESVLSFLDESLVKDVPKDIKIIQNKIWEPYRFAKS